MHKTDDEKHASFKRKVCFSRTLLYLLQAESSGVKFPESKGAGVYLRSGRVRMRRRTFYSGHSWDRITGHCREEGSGGVFYKRFTHYVCRKRDETCAYDYFYYVFWQTFSPKEILKSSKKTQFKFVNCLFFNG